MDKDKKHEELQSCYSEALFQIQALTSIVEKYSTHTGIEAFDLVSPPNGLGTISYSSKIGIGASPLGGRGVFATVDIAAGDVIELAPILVMLRSSLQNTPLVDYYFPIDDEGDLFCAVVLGWGSIYNHSDCPSAHWMMDIERREILFIANHAIAAGDEITHNYGPEYWNAPARAGLKR